MPLVAREEPRPSVVQGVGGNRLLFSIFMISWDNYTLNMRNECRNSRENDAERSKMSKQKAKDEAWADAKKRCRLNDEDIRMAKELGMTPKSLTKNIPSPSSGSAGRKCPEVRKPSMPSAGWN
jgi:hypothetical protein